MSAARTERLLNLITLLLNSRQPVSLRQLRELEPFAAYNQANPKSGERAFERDKTALLELGVPIRWVPAHGAGEGDSAGGYIIDRARYDLPAVAFAPQERAVLALAGSALAALPGFPGRDAVMRAVAKLDCTPTLPKEAGESLVPAVGASFVHAPVLASSGRERQRIQSHLEIVQGAVLRRHALDLAYQRHGSDQQTQRRVDPYGLYYRGGAWYLVGFCHLRGAQRTFHLARVRSVAPTTATDAPAHFALPADFDLPALARRRPWELAGDGAGMGDGAGEQVLVRVCQRLVPAMAEIFAGGARHYEGDLSDFAIPSGDQVVVLHVTQPQGLLRTLLPYGADLEVLAPQSLRRRLGDAFAVLARRYADRGAPLSACGQGSPKGKAA